MSAEIMQKAIETAREKLADASDLGALVKFEFNDDGAIFVDATQNPPAVTEASDEEPDCTVIAGYDVFQELLNGELDPTTAFMTGKIKIDGSMGVAMKLASVLG